MSLPCAMKLRPVTTLIVTDVQTSALIQNLFGYIFNVPSIPIEASFLGAVEPLEGGWRHIHGIYKSGAQLTINNRVGSILNGSGFCFG